jgi:hypothetical protein
VSCKVLIGVMLALAGTYGRGAYTGRSFSNYAPQSCNPVAVIGSGSEHGVNPGPDDGLVSRLNRNAEEVSNFRLRRPAPKALSIPRSYSAVMLSAEADSSEMIGTTEAVEESIKLQYLSEDCQTSSHLALVRGPPRGHAGRVSDLTLQISSRSTRSPRAIGDCPGPPRGNPPALRGYKSGSLRLRL